MIAAAKEFAHEVKDCTVAFAKDIKERAGSLFGREPQEQQAKAQEQASPPTPEQQAKLDELVAGLDRRLAAQQSVDAKLAELNNRLDLQAKAREEQVQALARQQQEQASSKNQEQTKEKKTGSQKKSALPGVRHRQVEEHHDGRRTACEIYGGIRSLAANMETREAALQTSTAALDTSIAQVQQSPAWLGQQTGQHNRRRIRKVVREDFGQPIEKAVGKVPRTVRCPPKQERGF